MARPAQAGGRPRESRVDDALGAAVRSLLAETGYAALTVEAVAARAGVGKAAIYRRFATKQEMIFSILVHDLRAAPPEDTGSLHGDLEHLTTRIARQLAQSSAEVMTGLLADIHVDQGLGDTFQQQYLAVERSIVEDLLDRAVDRGELAQRPDPAVVHVLLLGPLFAWMIMLDEEPAAVPELARSTARMLTTTLTGAAPDAHA